MGDFNNNWIDAVALNAAGDTVKARITDTPIPLLELAATDAPGLAAHLAANDPPIHCGLGRRHEGVLLISPVALTMQQAAIIGQRLRRF